MAPKYRFLTNMQEWDAAILCYIYISAVHVGFTISSLLKIHLIFKDPVKANGIKKMKTLSK